MIVCVQETWAESKLKIDNTLYISDRIVDSKNAVRFSNIGRPSGGIAFIVNSQLNTSCTFISDRIGILKINKLAIINLYLTYDNGSLENKLSYFSEL